MNYNEIWTTDELEIENHGAKFDVEMRRLRDGGEWEVKTIRAKGQVENYPSTDLSDWLDKAAPDIYAEIEEAAIEKLITYDEDMAIEDALDREMDV